MDTPAAAAKENVRAYQADDSLLRLPSEAFHCMELRNHNSSQSNNTVLFQCSLPVQLLLETADTSSSVQQPTYLKF